MPVTFEEHEQELAAEEEETEDEDDQEGTRNVQENRTFDGSCRAMTGQNGEIELRCICLLLLCSTTSIQYQLL